MQSVRLTKVAAHMACDDDFAMSQQLLAEGEDLYALLDRHVPTVYKRLSDAANGVRTTKGTAAEYARFWRELLALTWPGTRLAILEPQNHSFVLRLRSLRGTESFSIVTLTCESLLVYCRSDASTLAALRGGCGRQLHHYSRYTPCAPAVRLRLRRPCTAS